MNETTPRAQVWNSLAALAFLLTAMIAGYVNIGWPPVIIVGGSGLVGFGFWQRTYLKRPIDPGVILPLFLLTVAALDVHMAEEYLTKFGPAMSRLFDISWTERSFLLIFAFVGPTLYALTALGLFYRVPFAGFLAWFIFIGPGVAEFTHFIFPRIRPAIGPTLAENISTHVSNGRFVADMPNYWLGLTGRYYFPGLYTAVLPMIPGIWAIYRLTRSRAAVPALLLLFSVLATASAGASSPRRAQPPAALPEYSLTFRVLPDDHRLQVTGTVRMASASAARREIVLALGERMDQLRVEVVEPSSSAGWPRLERVEGSGGNVKWVVRPLRPIPPGQSILLRFSYAGGGEVATMYYVGPEIAFASAWVTDWYPLVEGGSDKGTGVVTVLVPAGWTVATGGVRRSAPKEEAQGTFRSAILHPTYFTFAAGKYTVVRHDGAVPVSAYLLARPRAQPSVVSPRSRIANSTGAIHGGGAGGVRRLASGRNHRGSGSRQASAHDRL